MASALVKRGQSSAVASVPSKRPAAGSSAHDEVPLLVSVVGGNVVTVAAVLGCLNTTDVTVLRRLHPAVVPHVAAIPWQDNTGTTGVLDIVRWRAALPAAVGCKLHSSAKLPDSDALTALRGVTKVDLHRSIITDAVVAALPPTLTFLNVTGCSQLTEGVSFTHLPALEALCCGATKANLADLPPSLRFLTILPSKAASFGHLQSLQVLNCPGLMDAESIASLPPSLEELDVGAPSCFWPREWSAAHLTRLRVLRAAECGIDYKALATLPPSLQVLDLQDCTCLTDEVSFAHLTDLQELFLQRGCVCNRMLATLPPSLELLNLESAHYYYGGMPFTPTAELPHLPALRLLDVSSTTIGDAAIASLPACLEELYLIDCYRVTQGASLDHLTALRVLQSSGTDLPHDTIEACRSRGCFAPADGNLGLGRSASAVVLLAGHRLVSCTHDGRVSLWDTSRGGDAVATLKIRGVDMDRSVLAVLADGHRVAISTASTGMYDIGRAGGGGIAMWDTRSASHTAKMTTRLSIDCGVGVCRLAVLHNGNLLAGCTDGTLRVVDADACVVVATLEGHANADTASSGCSNEVKVLAVLPDGKVASTASDCMVWVWDVDKRRCVNKLVGHTDIVVALVVLPDGRLASGSHDKTVRIWEMRSSCSAVLDTGLSVSALAVLPDGRLASAAWDGTLLMWDTHRATSMPPPVVVVKLKSPTPSALVPLSGGRLATCAGCVCLWQLPRDVVQVPW